jgi:hypothetical protein
VAVERQRPPALTAGLQVTGRHPRRNLQPELTPGLHAASPALMAGLCLTGRQGQFHPKSSKNYTSSAACLLLLAYAASLPAAACCCRSRPSPSGESPGMPDRPQKRQRSGSSRGASGGASGGKKPAAAAAAAAVHGKSLKGNEYLELFESQCRSFPADMAKVLDPDLPGGEERREELFELIDAEAALKYAWAVPDERALKVRPDRLTASPVSAPA